MKITLSIAMTMAALVSSAAVYEFQLTIKTTSTAEATIKASSNPCGTEGKVAYRKPGTMKVRIVTWGDGCESNSGFAMWDETCRLQYSSDSTFAWEFLQRIGAKGADVEGLWVSELEFESGESAGYLYGGGMGKVNAKGQLSLSGNLAGYRYAGQITKITETKRDCEFCSGSTVVVTVLDAIGWGVCDCEEADERTVAHGTWTMKYNAKASAKYDETGDIAASYSFPKYVTP